MIGGFPCATYCTRRKICHRELSKEKELWSCRILMPLCHSHNALTSSAESACVAGRRAKIGESGMPQPSKIRQSPCPKMPTSLPGRHHPNSRKFALSLQLLYLRQFSSATDAPLFLKLDALSIFGRFSSRLIEMSEGCTMPTKRWCFSFCPILCHSGQSPYSRVLENLVWSNISGFRCLWPLAQTNFGMAFCSLPKLIKNLFGHMGLTLPYGRWQSRRK